MDEVTRRAWAFLSRVAEPPNPTLAELVTAVGAVDAAERIRRREVGGQLQRATEARFELNCAEKDLDVLDRMGGRLVTAGDEEWPHLAFAPFRGVDVKRRPQAHPPLVLWAVGPVRLRGVAERAASIVGTRAATAYGEHVAADLAAGLVDRDVAVVSGGAYVL